VIFCAFTGRLFSQVDAVGPVLAGIELAGFGGAYPFKATKARVDIHAEGMPTAADLTDRGGGRADELRERPEAVAQRLVDRWLVPISVGRNVFDELF